jgi:hypothetical protein
MISLLLRAMLDFSRSFHMLVLKHKDENHALVLL